MKAMRFYLKRILALVLSTNLVGVASPAPSLPNISAASAEFREQSRTVAANFMRRRNVAAQSATLAATVKQRSQAQRNGGGAVGRAATPFPSGLVSDKPVAKIVSPERGTARLEGKVAITDAHGLVFVENKGQFDARAKFQVSNPGKTLWLTQNGIVFDFLWTKPDPNSSQQASSTGAPIPQIIRNRRITKAIPSQTERRVIEQKFVGASTDTVVETKHPGQGTRNYFSGSDPSKWQTGVRGYSEIIYRDLWKGVDLRLYGNRSDLEQEFIVSAGADLNQVQVAYDGIGKLEVANDGSLLVRSAEGQMRESAPHIYQEIHGQQVSVAGKFKLLGSTRYSFEVAAYDPKYPLVIDPTLLYSTYLGGSAGNNFFGTNDEVANSVAVDSAGNAYVAGYTLSTDFPVTPGAFETTHSTATYVGFVSKLNPTGSALVYSTYINNTGPNGVAGIAVDVAGNAYIAGEVNSSTFPTTANAYSSPCVYAPGEGQANGFVSVLNASGSGLLYSTCFGALTIGSQNISGIAIDSAGHAFVVGTIGPSDAVPTTANAVQTSVLGSGNSSSAFVTGFDITASGAASLYYSTYLGVTSVPYKGSGVVGNGVTVDSFGNVYITGDASQNLPTTPGTFQTSFVAGATCNDPGVGSWPCPHAFVAKLSPTAPTGQSLIYSTYLEGSAEDVGNGIAVDGAGNAYITGSTQSADFPVSSGAFQTATTNCGSPFFVTKLNPAGSGLVYSTYLCGNVFANGNTVGGIAVDSLDNAYIAGAFRAQASSTFPVTPDAFQSSFTKLSGGFHEAFLTELNPTGTALVHSTYLGGEGDDVATAVALDQAGNAYIAGHTSSAYFPVTPGALQQAMKGTGDAFVSKFFLSTSTGISIVSILTAEGGNNGSVTLTIVGTGFTQSTSVMLTCNGQASVPGTVISIAANGEDLTAVFNLQGVSPATCDVVASNPDGTSATDPQAFTVQQGGAPDIWVDLVGLPKIRGGDPQNYFLVVGNRGIVDATDVPLWMTFPGIFNYASNPSTPSLDTQSGGNELLAFDLPSVPASGIVDIPVLMTAPSDPQYAHEVFQLQDWAFNIPDTAETTSLTASTAVQAVPTFSGWKEALDWIVHTPIAIAIEEGAPYLIENGGDVVVSVGSHLAEFGICGVIAVVGIKRQNLINADALLDPPIGPGDDPRVQAIQTLLGQLQTAAGNAGLPCGTPSPPSASLSTQDITAGDPNDKAGSLGFGPQQYVAGATPLRYAVFFSNLQTATAPAQAVVVTDQLDTTNINLQTFSLGPISFGSTVITPPAGVTSFSGSVDLRPTVDLAVRVNAQLNPTTGLLSWTLQSIDPSTSLPPTDPTAGFLPPGSEGSVFFTVMPNAGVATGLQILNQATIVFDANAPMSTQTWFNTIDNTPPTSQVAALPADELASGFTVTWSGTDIGAGIQGFTIYVSDSGGPFTVWKQNTMTTSATFTGQVGHTYSFYSIATDLAGNVEGAKTAAEATTTVSLDTTPPTTTAVVSPPPNAAGWNNSNVTITLTSVDNPGGSGVEQITYSATGAQTIASTVVPGASTSFAITTEGITTVASFGTDNAGNVEAPHTLVIRLDKRPPTISGAGAPPANANGWNNTSVTVSFQCADAISGLAAGSPPAPTVLSTQGAGQSVTGTCYDIAGNSASATVHGINMELTPPILTITENPPANVNGWNNTSVTVSFAAVDTLSGVASVTPPVTLTNQGAGQIVNGSAVNLAGNVATGSITVNIDETPTEVYNQFDPVTKDVQLFGTDSLSSVAPGPVQPISVTSIDWHNDDDDDDMGCPNGDGVTIEIRTYQVFDLAGNLTTVVEKVKRRDQLIRAKLISIQYGQGSLETLPKNRESFDWIVGSGGSLLSLHEELRIAPNRDGSLVVADFDAKTNTTTIVSQLPKPKTKTIVQGLDLLKMVTSVGSLSVEF
jgi:hypothetical protein